MRYIVSPTVFIISLLMLPVAALGQATVSITPASQTIDLSSTTTATVAVEISGLTTPLYGFQFSMENSTGYWFLDSVSEGAFLGTGGVSTSCAGPTGGASRIVTNYGCTRVGAGSGITGGGILAYVDIDSNFQAGTTTLSLSNVKLSDIDSQPISFSTVNAQIISRWCIEEDTRDCGPNTDQGECEYGTSTCSGGEWGTCIGAVYPATEICDGLDNDCDGSSDEDWPTLGDACTAGVGECQGSGTIVCTGDTTVGCSATPGTPVDELCDGLDNDCDGSSDENWPEIGDACTVGLGECQNSGNYVCTADHSGSECSAVPGTPGVEQCPWTPEDENCDGINTEFKGDTYASGTCSGCVDVNDLSLVGLHFGETSASPNWEQGADLVYDNVIDIFDLVMVGANYNNGC